MIRGLLMAFVAFTTASCVGSAPPVPRDHYYRIIVQPPASTAAEPLLSGVITVAPLEADGLLRERPVLYSSDGNGHEVLQYDYHYWTDPPTRMVQVQIADFLRKSGIAPSVVTPDMRIPADFEVTGRIKRLERLVDDGPPRVVAEIQLALIELPQNRIVIMNNYLAEVASRDDSVTASVATLNQATYNVIDKFVNDMKQLSRFQGKSQSP